MVSAPESRAPVDFVFDSCGAPGAAIVDAATVCSSDLMEVFGFLAEDPMFSCIELQAKRNLNYIESDMLSSSVVLARR